MERWVWLMAYPVGFALMQLYLYRYRYFVQDNSRTEGTAVESSTDGSATLREQVTSETSRSPDDDRARCAVRGAVNRNEPVYTYCRECEESLA